jgi:hypothetical protein
MMYNHNMSDFLSGNFQVKRPVKLAGGAAAPKDSMKDEYRRKALSSVGGSMVFVEMDQLVWDGEVAGIEKKP